MNPKVFGVGMFRTGTTTLGRCLGILGYKSTGFWGVCPYGDGADIQERLRPHLPEILNRANGFDAFEDAPWLFLYAELDHAFPGSKFVLTLRSDSKKLAESEKRWYAINGEPPEKIPSSEFFIQRYEEHNARVREYFAERDDTLLEVCWETGSDWEDLCSFLQLPVPRHKDGTQLPIPHSNRSNFLGRLNIGIRRRLRVLKSSK